MLQAFQIFYNGRPSRASVNGAVRHLQPFKVVLDAIIW
jgi:hypothetical protein